jgi:hypothetical protein
MMDSILEAYNTDKVVGTTVAITTINHTDARVRRYGYTRIRTAHSYTGMLSRYVNSDG